MKSFFMSVKQNTVRKSSSIIFLPSFSVEFSFLKRNNSYMLEYIPYIICSVRGVIKRYVDFAVAVEVVQSYFLFSYHSKDHSFSFVM